MPDPGITKTLDPRSTGFDRTRVAVAGTTGVQVLEETLYSATWSSAATPVIRILLLGKTKHPTLKKSWEGEY